MGRFARGLALLRSSWSVLRQDPKLLVFPMITMVALTLVLATFALPFLIDHNLARGITDRVHGGNGRILAYVLTFLFYLATNFVIIFFNTALIACVMMRFRGQQPTLGDGLSAAMSRLPQICGWALVAATVGMILKMLEERVPLLGRIVVRIVGMGWAIVTYFVTPVLAVEGLGPKAAIARSAELLKRTWGESLTGQAALGILGFLFALPGIAIMFIGIAIGSSSHPASIVPIVLGIGLGVLWFIAIAILSSAMHQIFVAGAYVYAAQGQLPAGFEPELVQGAFRRR
jgi:Family of unknown function (DUF6159)